MMPLPLDHFPLASAQMATATLGWVSPEPKNLVVLSLDKLKPPGATADDVWLLIAIPVALVLVLRLFGPGAWRHLVAFAVGLAITCTTKAMGEAFQTVGWVTLFVVEAGALGLLLTREDWVTEKINAILDSFGARATGGNGSGGTL